MHGPNFAVSRSDNSFCVSRFPACLASYLRSSLTCDAEARKARGVRGGGSCSVECLATRGICRSGAAHERKCLDDDG